MDNIIEEMKQLGLNKYETKAYLALLEEWPVNGYMLSKNSGVPRSRIYEVIESLIKKEFVFEKHEENGDVFYPLEPENMISKIRKNYDVIISNVEKETKKLYLKNEIKNDSKIIRGLSNIYNFIESMLAKADMRVDISIWEEDLIKLQPAFEKVIRKDLSIKGIFFGENNIFKEVISHRRLSTYLSEKSERYIIIVIDNKEAVTGVISRGDDSQLTWTNDFGVIDVLLDYIIHDIMINVYSSELNEDERRKYEDRLDKCRNEFYIN